MAAVESHASVSGELSDLLIELASGLKRACVYGPNHPAVLEAATCFTTNLSGRHGDRGALSIAVAGSHLIVEVRPAIELMRHLRGVTTGLEHPLLGALADRLSQHEVGEIVLAEGVRAQDIAAILGFLSTDPVVTGRALGHEPEDALHSIRGIRIHRSRPGPVTGRDPSSSGAEAASVLWSAFARSALGIPEGEEERPYSVAEVANAIAVRSGDSAFDRRMTGHLLAISTNLGEAGPLQSLDLIRRFSDVLRRLDRSTLRMLLAMSGDTRLRNSFLRDAATALDVDVVFELVQTAGEDESSDISRWMLRLLSKMAQHAQTENGSSGHRSETAVREQIRALLSGWNLENPNPQDYEEALSRISAGSRTDEGSGAARTGVGPERTVAMALEMGVDGPAVRGAIDEMLASGQAAELVDLLQMAPHGELAERLWTRLTDRAVLRRLLEEEAPDWRVLDLVLPRAGLIAAQPLLDRLAEADSLTLRRRLFDQLLRLGPGVGEAAAQCLDRPESTPWYVLRNILSVLAVLETLPDGFDPWALTGHENPQVRLEAIKLCLRMPATRDRAVLRAIEDGNSRIAALGIVEAERGCPAEAEPKLVTIALAEDGEFREFRIHAIRALTRIGSPGALETLLEIAAPRRRGLRRELPAESGELLAAIRGLASAWPADARVREVLDLARSTGSQALRKAAE